MVTAAWVTPFPPDRNGGGGQVRQAHLLLALAQQASVELICPGPVVDQQVLAAVAKLTVVEVKPAAWRDRHRWLRRAADLAATAYSRQPVEVRAFAPYRRALAPELGQVDADVVLVEFAGLAGLLPTRRVGRWIITFHNLPSRMAAQQVLVVPHRRQRWLLRRDAAMAAAFETRAATDFDAAIVCTAADRAALGSPGPTMIVPNGVDARRFTGADLTAEPRVVFTGAMYTAPNRDGALWFCRDIWPRVRARCPDAHLDLVGARPPGEVRDLGRLPGVSVYADVPDVAPHLQAARVAVVPLRIGSGSRLKALEAMAAGRPVVGTSIGLEGLDLRPDAEVLVADEAAAFASAVVRLLGEDVLATSLAHAGQDAVRSRFDWASIGPSFAESVLAVVERGMT